MQITETALSLAQQLSEFVKNDPCTEDNFTDAVIRELLGYKNEGYDPTEALLVVAFIGIKELRIIDSGAIGLVRRGLESLGVSVLDS